MQQLILASSSPRRKELLENLHLQFEISSSNVDESFSPDLSPSEAVMELAARKARFVAEKHQDAFVIGSDTVVVLDGDILGKPESSEEAYEMLNRLSGKTHSVYTGVAIIAPDSEKLFYEKTDVTFWELSHEEIQTYIQSGEPFDKAGGYGIQRFGSFLVQKISGDYFTVVGLPVSRTVRELKNIGYVLPY
ncbi:septum formation protein Maf [Mesobacillus campisalis]|uniref:dTTP/UTP pyrophosphatase n=1 Tax=Mesobacillus campisalis TaxID=1408103 RepID=A0A0M2SHG9_9BACI|nr:Maf family protein [Mesobacillus campisalis]KKK33061.1 septum formation protein Maf [Mesobacillus campisalis]